MRKAKNDQNRPAVRCVAYTRKSTDDGLDSDFNSLDAQREACEAYVASQRHEEATGKVAFAKGVIPPKPSY